MSKYLIALLLVITGCTNVETNAVVIHPSSAPVLEMIKENGNTSIYKIKIDSVTYIVATNWVKGGVAIIKHN